MVREKKILGWLSRLVLAAGFKPVRQTVQGLLFGSIPKPVFLYNKETPTFLQGEGKEFLCLSYIASDWLLGRKNKMKVNQKKEGKENQLILNLKGLKP